MSDMGVFEASLASEQEQQYQQHEAADKLNAAIYDVKDRFGSFLFGARDLEEYHDRLALCKNDVLKAIEPHLFPRTGVVRRVLKPIEREFKSSLQRTADGWGVPTTTDEKKPKDILTPGPSGYRQAPTQRVLDNPEGSSWGVPTHVTGTDPRPGQDVPNWGAVEADPAAVHSPGRGPTHYTPPVTPATSNQGPGGTQNSYSVKPGDTLTDIAGQHGVDLGVLERANAAPMSSGTDIGSNPDLIHPGDTLNIPGKSSWGSPANTPASTPGWGSPPGSQITAPGSNVGGWGSPPAQSSTPSPSNVSKMWASVHTAVDDLDPAVGGSTTGFMGQPPGANLAPLTPGTGNAAAPATSSTAPGGAVRRADKTGPAMDLDVTYSPSNEDLVPEGDFKGYLDDVSQGAEEKADRNFGGTFPGGQSHDEVAHFAAWCRQANLIPSLNALDRYNPTDHAYFTIAAALQRQSADVGDPNAVIPNTAIQQGLAGEGAQAPQPNSVAVPAAAGVAQGTPGIIRQQKRRTACYPGCDKNEKHVKKYHKDKEARRRIAAECGAKASDGGTCTRPKGHQGVHIERTRGDDQKVQQWASRRTAAPNYLQKADQALTDLLNQKAEEFQTSVAPLQQALQTVQQAEQLEQQANPLNVVPPAGTVNVLPQAPGADQQQVDPNAIAALVNGGGGAPGGAPLPLGGDQGAPPAAGDQGALPPELAQQLQAARIGPRMLTAAMNHRRYSQIADIVASLPREHKSRVAPALADMFKAYNPRFSRDKFFAAVGLQAARKREGIFQTFPSEEAYQRYLEDERNAERARNAPPVEPPRFSDEDVAYLKGQGQTPDQAGGGFPDWESYHEYHDNKARRKRGGRPKGPAATRRQAAGTHPPISAKDSCQTCWNNSAERGGDIPYIDMLKQNHHEELVDHFRHDQYLDQQRHPQRPNKHGPGRYKDRAASNVLDDWSQWLAQPNSRGDEAEMEQFAQQKGYGPRAVKKLRTQLYGPQHVMNTAAAAGPEEDLWWAERGDPHPDYDRARWRRDVNPYAEDPEALHPKFRHLRGWADLGAPTQKATNGLRYAPYDPQATARWWERRYLSDPQQFVAELHNPDQAENFFPFLAHDRQGQITHDPNWSKVRVYDENTARWAKRGQRKQAWSGWSPVTRPPRQHKVAGWNWDTHLNGYITTAADKFSCDCGEEHDTPSYHQCKCGKVWNSYVVGSGSGREAALEKVICREIPVRRDVIVAKKRRRADLTQDLDKSIRDEQTAQDEYTDYAQDAERSGRPEAADRYREVRKDEVQHEKEFRDLRGMRKGAPFADYEDGSIEECLPIRKSGQSASARRAKKNSKLDRGGESTAHRNARRSVNQQVRSGSIAQSVENNVSSTPRRSRGDDDFVLPNVGTRGSHEKDAARNITDMRDHNQFVNNAVTSSATSPVRNAGSAGMPAWENGTPSIGSIHQDQTTLPGRAASRRNGKTSISRPNGSQSVTRPSIETGINARNAAYNAAIDDCTSTTSSGYHKAANPLNSTIVEHSASNVTGSFTEEGSFFKGSPFAGYPNFEACEEENADKRDSAAYCGEIKHRTEDKKKAAWDRDIGWANRGVDDDQLGNAAFSYSDELKPVKPKPPPKMNKPPADWHRRDQKQRWTGYSKRYDITRPGGTPEEEGEDNGEAKPKSMPKDWHHRDQNQRWTKSSAYENKYGIGPGDIVAIGNGSQRWRVYKIHDDGTVVVTGDPTYAAMAGGRTQTRKVHIDRIGGVWERKE